MRLQIGDLVLLRNKRRPFQKLSSVFYPRFASKIRRVTKIDKRYMPWCYNLSELPDSRKFYSFELLKLDKSFQATRPTTQQNSQINVKDVILQDTSTLRSGRVVKGKGTIMYIIERNGSEDIVHEATLKILKHSLGSSALIYNLSFHSGKKSKFVIWNFTKEKHVSSYQHKRGEVHIVFGQQWKWKCVKWRRYQLGFRLFRHTQSCIRS